MDATASSLLATLQQASHYHALYSRFSSYLLPFAAHGVPLHSPLLSLHTKPPPKTMNSRSATASLRDLAQRFLPFITQALQLLKKVYYGDRKEERDHELLRVYALVLDCFRCLLPNLEEDPHTWTWFSHRAIFVRYLVATGKYEKAETEAAALLKDLMSAMDPAGKVSRFNKGKGTNAAEPQILLPDPQVVGSDHSGIANLVIDIIICLCNCALKGKSKRPETYLRILAYVEQVQPWIRLLDHEASKRNHSRFLRPLCGCAAFLTKCRSFDCDLVSRFCVTALEECAGCSLHYLTYSATEICSCIDLNQVNGPSVFLDMLAITLELSQRECKDQFVKGAKEFLDFISSASNNLYDAQPNICEPALSKLNNSVQKFDELCPPVGSILSLYSAALYFKSTIPFSHTGETAPISSYATILASQEDLQSLVASIETLSSYFSEKNGEETNASHLFLPYLDALEFLCKVLLPCAEAGWEHFCSEGECFTDSSNWSNISKVLQVFCSCVIDNFSAITKNGEADRIDRKRNLLLESLVLWCKICFFSAIPYEDVTSISDIAVCTLFKIALVGNLHQIQSNSFPLVKEWVKVLCKEYNDDDKKYDIPFLYQLLTKKMDSNRYSTSLGRVTEKELLAYQHLESQYPVLCKIMQDKVIKVLLEELYSKKDSFLERSRILIAKARALRASGVDGLRGSLDCLSEAISLLRDAKSDSYEIQVLANQQLATACCLHALCAQENKLEFEVIMEDITSALDSWSKIDIEHCVCGDGFELMAKNMVPMLCSLIDLLSIKGYYKHHSRICELMAKTFKREFIPVQKLFALLSSNRRLGHSNCGVQIDVELISDALQNCDASAHLTEFWANCLEGHKPSLSMFAQSLLVNCPVFPEVNEKCFERSLRCDLGTMEIEQIAFPLISIPKLGSRSALIAGYLYYDLSQRLLSVGKVFEALSYARKALALRKRLLHMKFTYSYNKPGDVQLETRDSVATESWPNLTKADTIIDSFLSPWIVLRCYLESIFQVGSVYESIGNGAEAEFMFRAGKAISHLYLLDSFEITFASSLGQLYRKSQLWDMADSELRFAKKLLLQSRPALSCENCKTFLETTVNLQLGDLLHSRIKNSSQDRSEHTLEDAIRIYQSAFDNLDSDEFKLAKMEKAETIDQLNSKCKYCLFLKQPAQAAANKKASRNCRGTFKENNLDFKLTKRMTRARSCKTSIVTETEEPSTEFNASKKFRKKAGSKCDGDIASDASVCWACLMNRALDSGDVRNLLHLGVEFRRNSFRLSVQLKIAKTLGAQCAMSGMHEIHSLYRKCIFLLFSRSPGVNFPEVPLRQLMNIVADEKWKALSIDRALILYNMSLFLLKDLLSDQNRDLCCALANFQMRDVMTWVFKAFVFSREFPLLLQKVSRILAITLIVATADHSVLLPDLDKTLSLNHWAFFFHQASISTSLDTHYQYVKARAMDEAYSDNSKFLRFSFENISELEEHVGCFFKNLPDVPIICISMIGGDYAGLIEGALKLSSYTAWIMLSKIDSTNQPIIMFLPAVEISKGQHDPKSCIQTNDMRLTKEWKCPWGHTILDHVAPSFKLLMKENYIAEQRTEINECLGFLLRNIDESWFGPWSCLLRGYPINNQNKELLVPTLINCLESSVTSLELNPGLIKAILGGSESLGNAKACLLQLISYRGSYGHGGLCGNDKFGVFSASGDFQSDIPMPVMKLLNEAFDEPMPVNREPVIFVLDTYVQMFPWESLPSLRKQEVYRMPSVGSIILTLDRNYQRHKEKEQGVLFSSYLPMVNPFDAYYILNPDGDDDLKETEEDLKPWLEGFNLEGTTRVAQRSKELGSVLRDHEMFFYFGHGSGIKYISRSEIEKLEIRAAIFLMGCSSGILTCNGSYIPQGTPLSYLFAGSPAVVANLWDVIDRDINEFSKAVVNSWLEQKEETQVKQPVSCTACALLELPTRGSGKKLLSGPGNNQKWCEQCLTRRIASSIAKARDACNYKMITGAAPVCYGVPTILKKKG